MCFICVSGYNKNSPTRGCWQRMLLLEALILETPAPGPLAGNAFFWSGRRRYCWLKIRVRFIARSWSLLVYLYWKQRRGKVRHTWGNNSASGYLLQPFTSEYQGLEFHLKPRCQVTVWFLLPFIHASIFEENMRTENQDSSWNFSFLREAQGQSYLWL